MQAIYTQTDKKVEVADLSKRIVAFIVDTLLLFALIGVIDYLTYSSDEQAYVLKPETFLNICLGWLYFAGSEICACQATLGKYFMGLKVTSITGNRISFKSATIRYFAKPVSVVIFIMRYIFKTSENSPRTFHDKLAGSLVITY